MKIVSVLRSVRDVLPSRPKVLSGDTPADAGHGGAWHVGEGILARAAGQGVLVYSESDSSLLADALVEALPQEPLWMPVVVTVPVRSTPAGLADLVASAVGPIRSSRVTGVRLVLSDAGAPGPDSPAQLLADRLGVEVMAADGSILLVGSELLFVAPGRGSGGWRCFHPDGSTWLQIALRHPAPPWEYDLPAHGLPLRSGLVAEPIPAGIWVHGPDLGLGMLSDQVFGIAPADDRILLVVGGPDSAAAGEDDIEEIVSLLPPATRKLVHQIGYSTVTDAPRSHSLAVVSPPALPGGLPALPDVPARAGGPARVVAPTGTGTGTADPVPAAPDPAAADPAAATPGVEARSPGPHGGDQAERVQIMPPPPVLALVRGPSADSP